MVSSRVGTGAKDAAEQVRKLVAFGRLSSDLCVLTASCSVFQVGTVFLVLSV